MAVVDVLTIVWFFCCFCNCCFCGCRICSSIVVTMVIRTLSTLVVIRDRSTYKSSAVSLSERLLHPAMVNGLGEWLSIDNNDDIDDDGDGDGDGDSDDDDVDKDDVDNESL